MAESTHGSKLGEAVRTFPYVVFTCLMAGSGGLMYGYDLVIAGGILIMDDFLLKFYPDVYMHKRNAKENNYCKYNNQVFQLFSSILYLAALLATFLASVVSRRFGRKATMLCAGILFTIGTGLGASAQNLIMLIFGRALLGCGLGFANQVVVGSIFAFELQGNTKSLPKLESLIEKLAFQQTGCGYRAWM